MRTPSSLPPQETAFETLLRATLQDHVPATVDLDTAWMRVAERLDSNQAAQEVKSPKLWSPSFFIRNSLRSGKRVPILVAVAALLSLLLMGAGISGLYFWNNPGLQQIDEQHLYQDINQSQQIHNIKITVTKAYADTGRTLIEYTVQLPATIAKRYSSIVVATYSLTDRQGEEPNGGITQCEAFPQDGSPMFCLLSAPAFHPGKDVSSLTITWDISQVYLIRPVAKAPTEVVSGHWHFQFTIIFHHKNLGTGGPYPQPTFIRKP